MSFREKSAWVMGAGILVGGLLYFGWVVSASTGLLQLVPPTSPFAIAYTLALVCMAAIGHAVIAATDRRGAEAALDEREAQIVTCASHYSSVCLGVGVVLSLLAYLAVQSGDLLFYSVFGSLMVSHLAEYLLQIALLRGVLST